MNTGPMQLLPAVDIKAGAVFQNTDTDVKVSEFFGSPAEVIASFVNFGSKWIHLVDLDTAYRTGENSQLINNLVGSYPVNFQVSGGISNSLTLERALKSKAKWINLSTACLMDIEWTLDQIKAHSGRIGISLDVLNGVLTARGSNTVVGDLQTYVEKLSKAGCTRFVVTDNSTDGKMSGPNFDLLTQVSKLTKAEIISSGGVSDLSDLVKLREFGIAGVIVGKAFYTGQINFKAALDTCYK